MNIKTIIFDLGGVVVELEFSRFIKEVISKTPFNKTQSYILNEFWKEMNIYDKGEISKDEFYRLACDKLQFYGLTKSEFFESFNSVISHGKKEVIDLIKKIRSTNKYKLMALSNVNPTHWDYVLEKKRFGFLNYFDEIILSYEIHMTKPDPKVFQYAIEKAGCKPEEIVFIDDGFNNIRSAKELGLRGIHFTNVRDLMEEFKKLKIILD